MIALEGNMDFTGLFITILLIMISPSILLTIIGFAIKKRKPKTAKILFIIAVVYLVDP